MATGGRKLDLIDSMIAAGDEIIVEIEAASHFATESQWPDPATATDHVYGEEA